MKKIILKVLALFFISFTVVLAGCVSSPGDKFVGTWGFIGTSEHPSEHYLVIEKSKNSNSYELTQYHLYEHSYPDWKNKTRIYQKESSKDIHHLTENKDKLEFTPGGYFYIDNAGELRANVDYGNVGYKKISDKALTFEEMNKGRGYPDPDAKK